MGNSLSQSSRSLSKDSSSNSNSNLKDSHNSKSKHLNPDNLVLPIISNGAQKLRSTDNGTILQSGGTISGRKNNHSPNLTSDSELIRFLQKKNPTYIPSSQNTSFYSLLGHKKSHSDPDIVRKMMEENETEEDDDMRFETESNPNPRSIIAVSPSKAKIRSRKKKKAPEPPQPNTLPRTVAGRNNLKSENPHINQFSSSYDYSEVPKRPLPPIPLEEMPPAPPPPPPDYNTGNTLKGKNFQKNRRFVDKWKFSKPNFEYFAERRQRSKSLDRMENLRKSENEDSPNSDKFDRKYSLRNLNHRDESEFYSNEIKSASSKNALNDEIIDAAKKRAERLARSRKSRNLSFRSSMTQPFEANDAELDAHSSSLPYLKEQDMSKIGNFRNLHNSREQEKSFKGYVGPQSTRLQNPSQKELSGVSNKLHNRNHPENTHMEVNYAEPKKMYSKKTLDKRLKHDQRRKNYDEPFFNTQSYPSNAAKIEDTVYYKESRNQSVIHKPHAQTSFNKNNELEYKNGYDQERKPYIRRYEDYEDTNLNKEVKEHNLQNCSNAFGITKTPSYSYNRSDSENEKVDNKNKISRNFSRVGAIHKRSYEKKKKKTSDYRTQKDEPLKIDSNHVSRAEFAILPPLPNGHPTKYNVISEPPMISYIPNGTLSSSSVSEEEMEINLQLRPTLPRKPVDIPRFSPTDVWKSINLDFFKSHQQRSDISSEEGEDIMEEKIFRINRPVAPRRLIHDRSADSGISPDVESPVLLNETFDAPISAKVPFCPQNTSQNQVSNVAWIPQHDLDESECGSDLSLENKCKVANEIMQPKLAMPNLAMPNLMFPSRSLPRTDLREDIPTKEKVTNRDRRRRGGRNTETQHFNSLRNLKRVLGMKTKEPESEVNGLDANWSLSRSLPSFENVEPTNNPKQKIEVPQINLADNIRRSNSESRVVPQENGRVFPVNKNYEWRKSFPGQSSEGHIIYLPEYSSSTLPCQTNVRNPNSNNAHESNITNKSTGLDMNAIDKPTETKPKMKKKFSYQSTIRQLERKKLEEQLAKEVEEKEKLREFERYVSDFIEDEYRKVRVKDKSDISQRWRMHSLEVQTMSNSSDSNLDKCTTEVPNSYKNNSQYSPPAQNENQKDTHISDSPIKSESNRENHSPRKMPSASDAIQNCSQNNQKYIYNNDTSYHLNHFKKQIVSKSNEIAEIDSRKDEQSPNIRTNFQNGHSPQSNLKTLQEDESKIRQKLQRKELSVIQNSTNGNNQWRNIYKRPENMHIEGKMSDNVLLNGQSHAQRFYDGRSKYQLLENGDSNRLTTIESTPTLNVNQQFGKTELDDLTSRQNYALPFEETSAIKNGASLNEQQPTGMKKWLRRQNRDHQCHENNRPEPEGGRSSSDDCKPMDAGRNKRSHLYGANFSSNGNASKNYNNNGHAVRSNGVPVSLYETNPDSGRIRSEKSSDDRVQVHPKIQITAVTSPTEYNSDLPGTSPFMRNSPEDGELVYTNSTQVPAYELHTRLCRTNSGRTFESHSYYAIDRRKEDSAEYESVRRTNLAIDTHPNFFSSLNFERELKENVRKKSRDPEKRSRKYPAFDYDTDDSGSDRKEDRYQRHNVRNQKKRPVSEHKEPSFSRNHPHRNGVWLKSQTNGHSTNGRNPSIPKSKHIPVTQSVSNSEDLG